MRPLCAAPRAFTFLTVLTLAAAGCGRGVQSAGGPGLGGVLARERVTQATGDAAQDVAIEDRLLVRRASSQLEADDPARVAARTDTLVRRLGGYVVHSAVAADRVLRERSATLVARVPSDSLGAALDAVARFGRERARRSNSDDVTEQLIDLEARVTNLRATRDRMRRLLDEASGLHEVLLMDRELARAQTELDAAEGRLQYLRVATALAEMTVSAKPKVRPGLIPLVLIGIGKVTSWLFVL